MRSTPAVLALVLIVGCAHKPEMAPLTDDGDTSRQEAIGRAFMEEMNRGDYSAGEARFTDGLKKAIPLDHLQNFWTESVRKFGAFQSIEDTRVLPETKGWAVLLICRFARTPRTFYVGIDREGRISALYSNAVLPVGRAYVDRLSRQEYVAAAAISDAKMQEEAPAAKLAALWASLEKEHGAFYQITSVNFNEGDAKVVAAFADRSVTFNVCVNALGTVCGFHTVKAVGRSGVDSPEPQLDFERQAAP